MSQSDISKMVSEPGGQGRSQGGFPDTRWSLVLAARQEDPLLARRALEELCQVYWYPLYAYARRRGLAPEDAEDVTQDFFAELAGLKVLPAVDPGRGKLRAFMLGVMKNIIAQEHRRRSAAKRGGGQRLLSIDVAHGERCFAGEPFHGQSPDLLFDQSWAYALLESARTRLSQWYEGVGKLALWERLRPFLAGTGTGADDSLRSLAKEMAVNENALRSAVFQMRKRYRGLIEEEVRQTVAGPQEAAEELAYLKQVLAQA